MRTAVGWITLICLGVLTLLEGLFLALGQFGHDFNSGGPNPPGLQYGWLMLVLKIGALVISRRSSLPLLLVGVIDWVCGIVLFQMHIRHLSFGNALGGSWLDVSFVLLAGIYVGVTARRSPARLAA
jgi:hypothetical protein